MALTCRNFRVHQDRNEWKCECERKSDNECPGILNYSKNISRDLTSYNDSLIIITSFIDYNSVLFLHNEDNSICCPLSMNLNHLLLL